VSDFFLFPSSAHACHRGRAAALPAGERECEGRKLNKKKVIPLVIAS
jgi:hypothetical protein